LSPPLKDSPLKGPTLNSVFDILYYAGNTSRKQNVVSRKQRISDISYWASDIRFRLSELIVVLIHKS